MRNLEPTEYHEYYKPYIDLVQEVNFLNTLKVNLEKTTAWLQQLTDEQWNYRYEAGKWSVKEVWLHLLDAERVFAYRALRIARGDQTPLAGFDQNVYVPNSKAANRSGASIIAEYRAVRTATITLFENLDEEMLNQVGTASDSPVSALALGYIITGHELHHSNILRERYGV